MQRSPLILGSVVLTLVLAIRAGAEPSAATTCPPISFPNPSQNLSKNPSFETCGTKPVSCQGPNCNLLPASAAADWTMHSDNSGSKLTTQCVPTQVPQKGGALMLRVIAAGTESGVFQRLAPSKMRRMFSAWVRVRRGQVAIQLQGGTTGPVSWSTTHHTGEWEQLRVCTDGTVESDYIVIYNQAAGGGTFDVDRVEVLDTP
jgi:hypothetical protein